MKLILPIVFYRKGGVERVITSLIQELTFQLEKVVIVLPDKEIAHFSTLLPPSKVIVYESFSWRDSPQQFRVLSILNKLLSFAKKLHLNSLEEIINVQIHNFNYQYRVNHLIRKHQVDYCMYPLINRLTPPRLTVPLTGVAHDIFWRFSPLTYDEAYMQEYDKKMLQWLERSKLIFAVSEKTKRDLLSIFPGFQSKIKAIPLAGFSSENQSDVIASTTSDCPIFYFPSNFGVYKDHLTLLRAVLQLAERGHRFKVILSGKETDGFLTGSLSLSQQAKTQEYADYLQQCSDLYQHHHEQLSQYVKGMGYCSYEDVEMCYSQCSCVVFPSRYEGFGLAVSEAIVRGIPVIASDLDVFKEQVELYRCPDRVTLFPVGNVTALADCMESFLLNPKPKLSLDETQQRFSHWTWKTVAQEYINGWTLIGAGKV